MIYTLFKYIREKNHYRLGGTGNFHFKLSQEVVDDVKYMDTQIKYRSELELKKLSEKYKMSFVVTDIDVGLDGEDFVRNLQTVLCTFKAIK
jgi:hypothetical protein